MTSAADIRSRILDAVLARQLEPGARLGEQQLATLFGCSRTIVREAMIDLAARGTVVVSPRRGWFLTEVTLEKAREVYEAREIIETGLLLNSARRRLRLDARALDTLWAHLDRQKELIDGADVGRRSYQLGHFHVCLAECLGNAVLAGQLRDLTVLTTLFTMRHQTEGDARQSYAEHVRVIEALAEGDTAAAAERMREHLGTWERKVHLAPPTPDPLARLRHALRDSATSRDAETGA